MTRLVDDTQAVFLAKDAPLLTWYQHACYMPEILVERETAPGKQVVALGCKIRIKDGIGIQITSANKNEGSILQQGQITFTRFPSWDSPLRSSIKVGTVKGEVARMIRCTTPNSYHHLAHEFHVLTLELSLQGYPWRWIKRTFHHIKLAGMPIDGAHKRVFRVMHNTYVAEGPTWYTCSMPFNVLFKMMSREPISPCHHTALSWSLADYGLARPNWASSPIVGCVRNSIPELPGPGSPGRVSHIPGKLRIRSFQLRWA